MLDPLDGAAEHVSQRINLPSLPRQNWQTSWPTPTTRGWQHLRLLSSASNTYNLDYFGEDPESGQQLPMMNVFHRDDAIIRHFWGTELMYGLSGCLQLHD